MQFFYVQSSLFFSTCTFVCKVIAEIERVVEKPAPPPEPRPETPRPATPPPPPPPPPLPPPVQVDAPVEVESNPALARRNQTLAAASAVDAAVARALPNAARSAQRHWQATGNLRALLLDLEPARTANGLAAGGSGAERSLEELPTAGTAGFFAGVLQVSRQGRDGYSAFLGVRLRTIPLWLVLRLFACFVFVVCVSLRRAAFFL
jgi:hypothetical protein